MHTVLRRSIAGVGTYVGAHLLTWLTTLSILPRILKAPSVGGEDVSSLWHVYDAAGQPVWKAVGWVLLGAHRVPLRIKFGPGSYSWTDLMGAAAPDWLYLIPVITCFAGGLTVVLLSPKPAPIEWAVGSHLAIGYAIAAVTSAFVVELTMDTAAVFPALMNPSSLVWPLAVVGFPLLFGSLGAVVGQTSLLHRFRSTS